MLDTNIRNQLQAYLGKLQRPIALIATLDESAAAVELRDLLREVATLSDLISLHEDGSATRRPSFAVTVPGEAGRIEFAGIPMGHEFTSFVLALLQVGGHPPKVSAAVIEQIRQLPAGLQFETFISLSCHNCPDVVQALNLMALLNPGIRHVMIDGALFQAEVEQRRVMAVPSVYLNGEPFGSGRMELEQILAQVDTGAAAREAEQISARAPEEV